MFDVILDRDGVLNEDLACVYRVEDFRIPDGVVEGLAMLRDAGARFSVATNQSGIAAGKYMEDDMRRFNDHLVREYITHDITFATIAFCPHRSDISDCDCRKPKTGMLDQIEGKIGPIDWKGAWMIGDKPSDSEMILSQGGRAVLLRSGPHNVAAHKDGPYWEESDPALVSLLENPRHFVAGSVLEAANVILHT